MGAFEPRGTSIECVHDRPKMVEGGSAVEGLRREPPIRPARANERDGDGAGNGGRTRDIHLGKVALYH